MKTSIIPDGNFVEIPLDTENSHWMPNNIDGWYTRTPININNSKLVEWFNEIYLFTNYDGFDQVFHYNGKDGANQNIYGIDNCCRLFNHLLQNK